MGVGSKQCRHALTMNCLVAVTIAAVWFWTMYSFLIMCPEAVADVNAYPCMLCISFAVHGSSQDGSSVVGSGICGASSAARDSLLSRRRWRSGSLPRPKPRRRWRYGSLIVNADSVLGEDRSLVVT